MSVTSAEDDVEAVAEEIIDGPAGLEVVGDAGDDRGMPLGGRIVSANYQRRVDLTPADRRAYISYAETEQHKGFQHIDVDFEAPPDRHDGPG